MAALHVLIVDQEKDLGVQVTADLKPSRQCQIAYSKANKILGMIGRTLSYKSRDVLLQLYTVSQKKVAHHTSRNIFCAGLTDCKNFNGYRVRDNQRTQVYNQCFNLTC